MLVLRVSDATAPIEDFPGKYVLFRSESSTFISNTNKQCAGGSREFLIFTEIKLCKSPVLTFMMSSFFFTLCIGNNWIVNLHILQEKQWTAFVLTFLVLTF